MSLLQDSILQGTSCGHRDGKGAGVSTPKAPVRTHWASSPKSCSSTGAFLSLVQLQAVPEQHNLILIVFKTMTLAFHSADLQAWDLWVYVREGALSDHVARLATSETGVHH